LSHVVDTATTHPLLFPHKRLCLPVGIINIYRWLFARRLTLSYGFIILAKHLVANSLFVPFEASSRFYKRLSILTLFTHPHAANNSRGTMLQHTPVLT
jgi:hypothetical protein